MPIQKRVDLLSPRQIEEPEVLMEMMELFHKLQQLFQKLDELCANFVTKAELHDIEQLVHHNRELYESRIKSLTQKNAYLEQRIALLEQGPGNALEGRDVSLAQPAGRRIEATGSNEHQQHQQHLMLEEQVARLSRENERMSEELAQQFVSHSVEVTRLQVENAHLARVTDEAQMEKDITKDRHRQEVGRVLLSTKGTAVRLAEDLKSKNDELRVFIEGRGP
ncbi:hypothetical protein CONPUDRAFT_165825 [Coniophora puteana RWD-64-598 SS2]|uniref:Uncharacterized protein n=1 Tax=Coniophora puteana (strain RWD-64-598) TaxID=741705 RepID=A0A5M3MMA6_CONPW|nr:uncharacterized protein CONPUDRAFT_165825 [Coniophora puteana RWD-64-598 SS2]EIW80243.1 hypothetical protein CONPUDRAFT_165825 [Coniophora puteana RWD-64-598 SS2]